MKFNIKQSNKHITDRASLIAVTRSEVHLPPACTRSTGEKSQLVWHALLLYPGDDARHRLERERERRRNAGEGGRGVKRENPFPVNLIVS